jgi:hypothetical protein
MVGPAPGSSGTSVNVTFFFVVSTVVRIVGARRLAITSSARAMVGFAPAAAIYAVRLELKASVVNGALASMVGGTT